MLSVSRILIPLLGETLRWWRLAFRSTRSIKAENLFLRRQLALYVERGIKPRRVDPVTRISLTFLSRFFNWREALVVVRPQTMIRWHRAGWKLFWRLKSRPGRPPIPQQSTTPDPCNTTSVTRTSHTPCATPTGRRIDSRDFGGTRSLGEKTGRPRSDMAYRHCKLHDTSMALLGSGHQAVPLL